MTTTTAPTATETLVAINAYADLTKAFARHMAWQNACRAYSISRELGIETAAPKVSSMPSKAAKHRMYGDAGRVISLLHLDVPRPSTLPEIAAVIAAASAVLMAR